MLEQMMSLILHFAVILTVAGQLQMPLFGAIEFPGFGRMELRNPFQMMQGAGRTMNFIPPPAVQSGITPAAGSPPAGTNVPATAPASVPPQSTTTGASKPIAKRQNVFDFLNNNSGQWAYYGFPNFNFGGATAGFGHAAVDNGAVSAGGFGEIYTRSGVPRTGSFSSLIRGYRQCGNTVCKVNEKCVLVHSTSTSCVPIP